LEIILLPYWFPLNFFDLVGYARVHIAPILIAADRKPAIRNNSTPDLSHLLMNKTGFRGTQNRTRLLKIRPILSAIKQTIGALPYTPQQIHTHALQRAERFILDRIEWDGTLYSYFSATFLMVFSLLALGYSKKHPVITRSIDGLKALIGAVEGRQIHIQNSTSTVWDTALLCYALQEANVSITDPMIQKAGQYLYARQHDRYGDWIIHNPGVIPGGWGFSDINTINPDVDDTTACLRAIRRLAKKDQTYHRAWKRGLNWLMSMQNDDGGWPAFEKNTDKKILTLLPFEGADAVSIDPSSADLTGRTLEFLGAHAGLTVENRRIEKAVNWLIKHQQADGSWYGRWGVSYIYGTWAAVTGMRAVGISSHHPAIQKAVQWLLNIQNEDGGWGESCRSDTEKKYTPLGRSTPSQTAWALDALIAASREPADAMERGMHFLIESGAKNDWTTSYPTGAGLPGGFYIHYHSYRYIWPLLAFSHYVKKYSS
jgi:sporulenol synthase